MQHERQAMMNFEGKTAAIIGGGGGIGRSIALALAREGVDVFVGDVNGEAAASVATEVVALGCKGTGVACDLGSDDSVEAFANGAFDALGRVDLLFNHAGASVGGRLELISSDDWQWLLNINIIGLGRSIRNFLPRMAAQGGGHIVNTSSGLGVYSDMAFAAPYGCTKAAIISYSRNLGIYALNQNIDVSVFCPNITRTPFVGSGRVVGLPSAAAGSALHSDNIDTPEMAAACLIAGLGTGEFMVSAVPGTQEMLRKINDKMFVPGGLRAGAVTTAPIVQHGSIRIDAAKRAEMIEVCLKFAALSQRHVGCIAYETGIDLEDSELIKVFEVWRDGTVIDAHAAAPETLEFITKIFSMGASDFTVKRLAG